MFPIIGRLGARNGPEDWKRTAISSKTLPLLVCGFLSATALDNHGETVPDVSAGISWDSSGYEALIWTPGHLYRYSYGLVGPPVTIPEGVVEVLVGTNALSNVQGVVYEPDFLRALVWTPTGVYATLTDPYTGAQSTIEILQPAGGSISGAQGIVWDSLGYEALIWTPGHLYRYSYGLVGPPVTIPEGVVEVLVGTNNLSNVQGVVYEPDFLRALIWTPTGVYATLTDPYTGAQSALEILQPAGGSISGAQGIVWDSLGYEALIWTPGHLYRYSYGLVGPPVTIPEGVVEVLVGTNALSNVQGVVCEPDFLRALVWTPTGVYTTLTDPYTGAQSTMEILQPAGGSISGAQGIVWDSLGYEALIWTPGHLYRYSYGLVGPPVTIPEGVVEVLVGTNALSNVQGVVYEPDFLRALVWTPTGVYTTLTDPYTGAQSTMEILQPAGGSISGAQGIVWDSLGYEALIWTPGHLYRYSYGLVGPPVTIPEGVVEVLVGTNALSNVQGVVYEPDFLRALVWTPSGVYATLTDPYTGAQTTVEVLDPGAASIMSYDPAEVPRVQVVVHHAGLHMGGPSGAGIVGTPATSTVQFVGESSAATIAVSSSSPATHSTVIGTSPSEASPLIVGPNPVAGVVTGNSMKLFGFNSLCVLPAHLFISRSGPEVMISWTGVGFTLQESPTLSPAAWTPIAGTSPVILRVKGPMWFFRLGCP